MPNAKLLWALLALGRGAEATVISGTTVTLDPATHVTGTLPARISFGFIPFNAITGDAGGTEKVTITASLAIWTAATSFALYQSTIDGIVDTTVIGTATTTSPTTLEVPIANGQTLGGGSVVVLTSGSPGTNNLAALAVAGTIVTFTFVTTQDTTPVTPVPGWTTNPASGGGDPIARFGDVERLFELPPGVLTTVLESPELIIKGSVFEGNGPYEQWFDRFVLIARGYDDRFIDIRVKKNLHERNASSMPGAELQTLDMKMVYGTPEEPRVPFQVKLDSPILSLSSFIGYDIAVGRMQRWQTKLTTIGRFPREFAEFAGPSMHLFICSAPAAEYYGSLRHLSLKFAHLDMVFQEVKHYTLLTGILPELWGVQPMSETTKSYIKWPESEEKKVGNFSKMAMAGGVGMAELQEAFQERSGNVISI